MRPTLFSIGSGAHAFPVHSYGFLIAIGLVVGVAISLRRGRSVGIETGTTLDLTFYAVLVGLVGARVLYVLMHAGEYARLCGGVGLPRSLGQKVYDCTAPLRFWQGGLVFLGGAVLSAVVMLFYASPTFSAASAVSWSGAAMASRGQTASTFRPTAWSTPSISPTERSWSARRARPACTPPSFTNPLASF
jgi:phosphatidylglycerol:prolipoprotein diacylglycerol transferase